MCGRRGMLPANDARRPARGGRSELAPREGSSYERTAGVRVEEVSSRLPPSANTKNAPGSEARSAKVENKERAIPLESRDQARRRRVATTPMSEIRTAVPGAGITKPSPVRKYPPMSK
ncbi:MAG: hypothetical protein DHS20C14_01840 [Phycisphaeraceae bacterium]|nr:MAG: hypothetical protein DHS20C14_01840 [Phycisphaeraceae bacterium]